MWRRPRLTAARGARHGPTEGGPLLLLLGAWLNIQRRAIQGWRAIHAALLLLLHLWCCWQTTRSHLLTSSTFTRESFIQRPYYFAIVLKHRITTTNPHRDAKGLWSCPSMQDMCTMDAV